MRWSPVLAFVATAVLLACSKGESDATPKCIPGSTAACLCPDARSGAQLCNGDGTYSTCICAATDATVPDSTDASPDTALDDTRADEGDATVLDTAADSSIDSTVSDVAAEAADTNLATDAPIEADADAVSGDASDVGGNCDMHAGDTCNIVKQDCADPTATCIYDDGSKHNACAKLTTGTKLKGETCAAQADCDRGLFCLSGKCSPACCLGDASVCGSGGTCSLGITNSTGTTVAYHACSYLPRCNPFKYDCPVGQVCAYSTAPDVFRCVTSLTGVGTAPGGSCAYANACGESQTCLNIGSGGALTCALFCWLDRPDAFTPGATSDGRFPADGTCTIKGVSHGTCQAQTGVGGGLGVCKM